MTQPTTRTTASIYLPCSLRAVFSHYSVNQTISVESVIVRNSQGKIAHAFTEEDVSAMRDGAYEVILPAGFPEGSYIDTWSVRGVSSPFRIMSSFWFRIRTDQHAVLIREE